MGETVLAHNLSPRKRFSSFVLSQTLFGIVMLLPVLANASAVRDDRQFQDCPECPVMLEIQGGAFLMGSPPSEHGHMENHETQHRVTIETFAVGAYEVTFREWVACVDQGYRNGRIPEDEGWGRGRYPVINVSWEEAELYVKWLSTKTGQGYRLLSETEWEYVARSKSTAAFSTGSKLTNANHNRNVGRQGRTTRVGKYEPNDYGLFDVHGNVAEWVADCWHDSYNDAPIDGSAWITNCTDQDKRVVRGGGWNSHPNVCRSASRVGYTPEGRRHVGFRVAKTCSTVDGEKQCFVSGISERVD